MSDRAALLAAICAQPDEDTPRLVYADWLDEHGEGKRAAAIRAGVEYHRLKSADTGAATINEYYDGGHEAGRIDWSAVDPDLAACAAAHRAFMKLRLNLTLKGEGLPRFQGGNYAGARRGFYDGLNVTHMTAFLEDADAVFRAAPITSADFFHLTEEEATDFANTGHLARLRELYLGNGVEMGAVRVLGSHPDAAGVRRLHVTDLEFGEDAAEALAAGTHWSGLEHLVVDDLGDGDAPADDRQVAALFGRPQFRNLRGLRVEDCGIGDGAVKAIAKNLPELRALELGGNPISERGFIALAGSKTLRHLRHLDLNSCEADGADPAPLITTANLPNLTMLKLGDNDLDEPNPKVLAGPGRGPGLRVLELGNTFSFSFKSAEALAACPAVRGVWHLDLNETGLDDDHLERFVHRAAFDRLTYLDLGYNELTGRGVEALADWPGAAPLQWLDLRGNSIGAVGAGALAASPYLKNLKYLTATGRGITTLKKRFKKVFG